MSFSNNKDLVNAYQEIVEMTSPIMGRHEIKPEDLDDTEQYVLEAIDEYRKTEFYKEFKNYKNFYEDAKKQNNEIKNN